MAVPVFEIGPVDQNIIYAFIAGFLIAWLIFGIRIAVLKSRNKKEVRDLRNSLVNRIDIETSSIDRMKTEIEDLKKKNNNLKISMNNLSGKAGRREKIQLHVYQSAIEKMSVRAPGFAPAWHIVLKECEEETGKSLSGTIPFIQRNIPTVGTGWANTVNMQAGDEVGEINSDSELSGSSSSVKKKQSLLSRITGGKA
ncbi:MAG: hypothetical protein PQJ61_15215 [Spirochaetales bacterium]|uniref:Uncharacterized protein n=1 Tax=Candidatus Thalassospirochaeta sargassi TaxID=3119039 RepID=A0AAJ1IF18_9SPIO|nr:hypothetical protein [Spirochaetales bacterium]